MHIGYGRMCVSVCLFVAARLHHCTYPDATLGMVGRAWVDLQSVHGFRWYGNIRA